MNLDLTNAVVVELYDDGTIDILSSSDAVILVSDRRFGNGNYDEYQVVTKDTPDDIRDSVGDHAHMWPIDYVKAQVVTQDFHTDNVHPLRPRR